MTPTTVLAVNTRIVITLALEGVEARVTREEGVRTIFTSVAFTEAADTRMMET